MLSKKLYVLLPIFLLFMMTIMGFEGCHVVEIDDPVVPPEIIEGDPEEYTELEGSVDNGETETVESPLNYRAEVGDIISINARPDPEDITASDYEVADDGTIKLIHIGRIDVEGLTKTEIEDKIESEYEDIYSAISITVTILRFYYVSGEVQKAGRYQLVRRTGLIEAIDTAGGFTDFAKRTKVLIIRKKPDGKLKTIKVNCRDIQVGKRADVILKPDDRIFIDRSGV